MRIRFAAAAVVGLAIMLIAGCVSAPSTANLPPGDRLLQLVNDDPVDKLVVQSSVPMFFDGELVVRRDDVELLWTGLREAGFEIAPSGYSIEPASAADYGLVAQTFDMESFFTSGDHVPDNAQWLVGSSSIGSVRVLFADGDDGQLVILGLARS